MFPVPSDLDSQKHALKWKECILEHYLYQLLEKAFHFKNYKTSNCCTRNNFIKQLTCQCCLQGKPVRSFISFQERNFSTTESLFLTISQSSSLRNGALFVLAWVAWVPCFCGQRASVHDVPAREINIVQSQKKSLSFTSYTLQTYLIFQRFLWIFEFKVILKLFPEQMQSSGLNPVNIPCENLAY